MDTWEQLQARIFHLAWLAEELPDFVATPGGSWLYRQMVREAAAITHAAAEYVAETERADRMKDAAADRVEAARRYTRPVTGRGDAL